MSPRGQSNYFIKVELISLENYLCRTLDRTAELRDQALSHDDLQGADRIRQLQKWIAGIQRSLNKLQ
jgi:hypothetical protein